MSKAASHALLIYDGRSFIGANESALKLFQFTTYDEFKNRPLNSLNPPNQADGKDSISSLRTKIDLVYRDGECDFPWIYIRSNGDTFYARVKLSLIHLHEQEVIEFFIKETGKDKVNTDLSELNFFKHMLQENAEEYRDGLVDTIGAFAKLVEARDPYTFGHQSRVSQLAVAISEEMEQGASFAEGVRLGALIHDIGKIHIPAEILTKPTKLSDLEYDLIKGHAKVGYNILKNVRFPWPIAKIALQHHERMDGSGYPNGLKGKAICLEARIVAVADVVEAISSFRPYRPALGNEVALKEISVNSGTLFDATVVKACLKVFNENGFTFIE